MSDALTEYYEPDGDPREALGRAARRLKGGGALYLGGGIGVESTSRVQGQQRVESYSLVQGEKGGKSFDGPLSAVTHAFTVAGASTAPDTPGGAQVISDPAIAARLRELDASEREERASVERIEAQLKRARSSPQGFSYGLIADDGWQLRRCEEARANLSKIAAERRRLLAGKAQERETVPLVGALREAEVGKPGTNWKQVTPEAKKKLSGILAHYRGKPHPWQACVDDNTKRFGLEGAKRVCSVVKDLNMRTTKWRSGGKHSVTEEAALDALVIEAAGRIEAIEAQLGEGAALAIAESAKTGDESFDALAEGAFADLAVLALAEHPLGEGLGVAHQPRHRDGQFTNVTARVTKSKDVPAVVAADGELRVNTQPVAVEESFIGGLLEAAAFSEFEHPRDLLGKFKGKLRGLKPGETAALPDGVKVRRNPEPAGVQKWTVTVPAVEGAPPQVGRTFAHTADAAATMAMLRSAQSTDPKSLGGATRYESFADLRARAGINVVKSPRQAGISAVATERAARTARERHRRLRTAGL